MFLGAVSAGLVALGLMATATHVGTAFYAFGFILLATLALVGFVMFDRALQSGMEDFGYARRIAQLRAYYFDNAPELGPYLYSVPPTRRLAIQGLQMGAFQGLRTVAGMVAVITSVLAGSTAGLLTAVSSNESPRMGANCRRATSTPTPRRQLHRLRVRTRRLGGEGVVADPLHGSRP